MDRIHDDLLFLSINSSDLVHQNEVNVRWRTLRIPHTLIRSGPLAEPWGTPFWIVKYLWLWSINFHTECDV